MQKKWENIENSFAENVNVRAVATDGGTQYIEVTIKGKDGYFFYVDGRINSETRGGIFTDYPDHASAEILNRESKLFKSIKQFLIEQNETE